jgi:Fuc2NAc and GlcNAc transferase
VAVVLAILAAAAPATESDLGVLSTVTGLPSLTAWLPAGTGRWLVVTLDIVMVALLMLMGVWWVNLYNFMDGIDGLAAAQALFMLVAALLVKYMGPGMDVDTHPTFVRFLGAPVSAASVVLAAAVAGFLVLNWAPAKVFLGDAGSLFLGFSIFATAAHDVTFGDMSIWSWLILGSLFLVDATVTLLRRWFTGQSVTAAHRSHLYQRLSRQWGRHWAVALVYSLINVAWILPLALLAHRAPTWAPLILVIACSPAAIIAWRAGAGLKET